MKYLTAPEAQLISCHYGRDLIAVPTFKRLQRNGEIFYCQEYRRVTQRNSYTIMYYIDSTNLSYGQILYFINIDNRPSAMVKKLHTLPMCDEFHPVQSIVPVQHTTEIQLVDLTNNIFKKCMFLELSDMCYVVKLFCALNMD